MNAGRKSWSVISVLIGAPVLLTLSSLFLLSLGGQQEIWQHLYNTVLADYLVTTFVLALGVGICTLIIGVSTAIIVSQYNFFGKRILEVALLLPMAMPAYIIAYAYTGLLDVAGPVQSTLRGVFGWQVSDYWFPNIRSLGGAILVLSLVLYPYVYLLARTALLSQSPNLERVSRLLGLSRGHTLLRINLPIARPAIVAGVSLVLMETLADFGAVSYFGLSTFTTGIFRTWFGLDSVATAAQLALMLLVVVFLLVYMEQLSRHRAEFHAVNQPHYERGVRLSRRQSVLFILILCLPIIFGFLIPFAQLSYWLLQDVKLATDTAFWQLVINTLSLAAISATLIVLLALLLTYSARIYPKFLPRFNKKLSGLGYAVPGLVIALGLFAPLTSLDKVINQFSQSYFGITSGLLITGSIAALLIAYSVRFLSVALGSVDAGLGSIKSQMDQAAQSMGLSPFNVLRRVHLPLMRGSLLTALILVFVDVMKELPATLVLRPFNFNTLAVKTYELASDERLNEAALPSIAIVVVGLIPIIILSRLMRKQQP